MKADERRKTLREMADEAKRTKFASRERGRDAMNLRIGKGDQGNSLFLACQLYSKEHALPPSTKLTAAMAVIMTWCKEHPDDKIIGIFIPSATSTP